LLALAIASVTALHHPLAHAWDGSVAGAIAGIDVAAGDNYGFRISLVGLPLLCTGGLSWAYLNDTDSNYKVYVATLLAAKTAGSRVFLWSTTVGGYCHIGYIQVGS
jgi:hypothetical protein